MGIGQLWTLIYYAGYVTPIVSYPVWLWNLFIYAIQHESSPQAAAMMIIAAVRMIMQTWRPVTTMVTTARWDH